MVLVTIAHCMQNTFARATHSAYAAGRPSVAYDEMVSCIQHCTMHVKNLTNDVVHRLSKVLQRTISLLLYEKIFKNCE